ncbi:small acid-soluble spore protein Tlp [Cohnella thermotolerans]|jgi:small acid-soluble spore protein (thioredoxin-like protein)|uniref:small acid-soluble spore protein Tlp n=1 Tax=Cohnella thermotolerans TaxID=329858 RepID=UPI0003FDA080|nr:small acid-soluble spore protein Tlp [Cohnella thermotolerans]
MAKPDNRADNARKLRNAADNTLDNLEEAEDYLDEHADEISPQEREAISDKNARRRHSVKRFEEEIEDES